MENELDKILQIIRGKRTASPEFNAKTALLAWRDKEVAKAYQKGRNDNMKWCTDFIEAHGGLADNPTRENQ